MTHEVTNEGRVILDAVGQRLGRSPSKQDMDAVHDILQDRGFTSLIQGNTTRYVFALPDNLVTDGAVLKIPRKADDIFEDYPLKHLGVDQNIRAIYTAEYLSEDGLAPPVIDFSDVGSYVVFPFVTDLDETHMAEFEQKAAIIESREDVFCATKGEVSGTPDTERPDTWGIYNEEVVLRDVGSVGVRKDVAPDLDLVDDPYWHND